MAKAKAVNLTLANIEKDEAKLAAQRVVEVTSPTTGTTYKFKIDKKIRETVAMEMVAEMLIKLAEAREKKIDMSGVLVPYTIMMVIKKFTSLGESIPNEIEKQIEVMKRLTNLKILDAIIAEFDAEEVNAVIRDVTQAIERTDQESLKMYLDVMEAQEEYEDKQLGLEE